MSNRFKLLSAAGFAALMLTASFCRTCAGEGTNRHGRRRSDVSVKNIVENAVNSKDHTTLVAAVKAAGLVDTLEGTGPFTVFAPTNEAFAKLPAGTVATLLKPENKATLTKMLTYHVVPGKLEAADLTDGKNPDHRRGRAADGEADSGGRSLDRRCQGRHVARHDPQCESVERRDPRRQHGPDAGLISPEIHILQGLDFFSRGSRAFAASVAAGFPPRGGAMWSDECLKRFGSARRDRAKSPRRCRADHIGRHVRSSL